MVKIIKKSPPRLKWVDFDEEKPASTFGTKVFYGVVNEGTPHECFSVFFAKYGDGKLYDMDGDIMDNKPTHWLKQVD